MQDNVYERIHQTLTWKRIIGFNVVLFLIVVVPLSVRLAQQDTENRSGAAGELEAPVVTPPPSYPAEPPRIDRVSMFFGKAGDTVVVLGNNFGNYQWGSKVFLGNVEAPAGSVVRWTNTVLEVKIPDGARTGKVWVVVNTQQSSWDGSLLLYDVSRAGQVGLQKVSSTESRLFVTNGAGAVRGMVELGHASEPVNISAQSGISITSQSSSADSLGKKLQFSFDINPALTSAQTILATITYPGIGAMEIVRVELYDSTNRLISVFSDPLSVKILP